MHRRFARRLRRNLAEHDALRIARCVVDTLQPQLFGQLQPHAHVAAAIGALIGGRLIAFVDPATLRSIFGWFVLLMASLIMAEEISPAVGTGAGVLAMVAAGMSFACNRYAHCPLDRLVHRQQASVTG